MTVDPKFVCSRCQDGQHADCSITVARVQFRTNYFRCSCDGAAHPTPWRDRRGRFTKRRGKKFTVRVDRNVPGQRFERAEEATT